MSNYMITSTTDSRRLASNGDKDNTLADADATITTWIITNHPRITRKPGFRETHNFEPIFWL